MMLQYLKKLLFGSPLNPLSPESRQRISLIALIAWVGLGADALSSACYGPEEAYLALGTHTHLALYIALITVVTIFIISIGYNQVIALFPNGGGGYKVASKLLHPYAGVVAGSALIVDYVLTITVSIVSGTDALFSFLPLSYSAYKLHTAAIAILFLLFLNLRGMKEAIKVLVPIFFGFLITHIILIIYGIFAHANQLHIIVPMTLQQTHELARSVGWIGVIGLTLHAYSLGSGTYTGLEAISNNVQRLAEPRVRTGKRAMLYMAISLSFMAGGIILLYLLWDVRPVAGKTLNAVLFHSILGDSVWGQLLLIIVLQLEAGLLFVAANTGFADGPNVLANMAIDRWVPSRFRHLSNRLVVQNGLIILGIAALVILYWTNGNISMLVLLYSINVFITFSLSLLGVSVYWATHRQIKNWRWHLLLSIIACFLTTTILSITLFYKFMVGGWLTIFITSSIICLFAIIRRHYKKVTAKLLALDKLFALPLENQAVAPYAIDPKLPTAIIFVNQLSVGMHTLLSIIRLFPGQFKNFVFLTAGEIDAESFSGQSELEAMQIKTRETTDYFVKYCYAHQFPAEGYALFGTDLTIVLKQLADQAAAMYPHGIFFASQLVFQKENLFTRWLHNQTPQILQHHLHFRDRELVIMPMKI